MAVIFALAVGAAGGTALAGPETDTDPHEDLTRHISTATPVTTDDEPSGRPRIVVAGHDLDVGGDTICMGTTELGPCGGAVDLTSRHDLEPMSRTAPD